MSSKKFFLFIVLVSIVFFVVPGVLADNTCINCHQNLSAFNETEQQFNEIRIQHLARDIPCSLECHTTTLTKFAKSNYLQWTNSKHALFNVTCDRCHGGDPASEIKEKAHVGIERSSSPNSTVFYRNVPETCGKCHKAELNEFKGSKHFQRLEALERAPTCDTCHLPHEFKVLNVSDFSNLCSNCHNLDTRIDPDVPDKAIAALENAEKLKDEIKIADTAIRQAKVKGKDVSVAQKDLDTAMAIRDSLPILWHAFDLESFGNVISNGINSSRKAEEESGMPVARPSTPGFGTILSLAGVLIVYLLLRKMR